MLSTESGKGGDLPHPNFTWAELLQEVQATEAVDPNADAKTPVDLCAEWGWPDTQYNRQRAKNAAELGVSKGWARKVRKYVETQAGYRKPVDAYILVETK